MASGIKQTSRKSRGHSSEEVPQAADEEVAGEPAFEGDPELVWERHPVPTLEDAEVVQLHLFQQAVVDQVHCFGGEERGSVIRVEVHASRVVEGAGTLGFEAHQFEEAFVVALCDEVLFRVPEALQVFLWQVDVAPVLVWLDVAEDIGQLQGVSEVDGVLACLRVLVAEDFNADQPNAAGNAVAVVLQLVESAVSALEEIALEAIEQEQEVLLRELEALDDVCQREEHGMEWCAGVEIFNLLAPPSQPAALLQ